MHSPLLSPTIIGCDPCNSEFGCCPDGITPKTSEEDSGCGCDASLFGCCLDGLTAADGPDFQGCPTKPGAHCDQEKVAGPCTEYVSKWFYDAEYGGCNRFWYGGCEPGKNHFENEDTCSETCVQPRGAGVCYLPKNRGSCDGNYNEWYFDKDRKMCAQFSYSGCLGNGNRFPTKEACEEVCKPKENVPICSKPKLEGACAGDYPRFAYNRESGECEAFSYSGCFGNNNRFLSLDECESACKHQAKQKLTDTVCKMYIEAGNCEPAANGTNARWGYDERKRRCIPFYHTGCGGNQNNFVTREACEKVCPTIFAPLISLPAGEEVLAEKNTYDLQLVATIRANPPPRVRWIRNGREISEYDPAYQLTADNSLIIKQVGELDAGEYTVTADNGVGEPASADIRVIVYPLMTAVSIKVDKSIFKPESDVVIPCTIRGYPPPRIEWLRVERRRGSSERIEVPVVEDRPRITIDTYQTSTVETQSSLTFRNAAEGDSGTYRCSAASDHFPTVSDGEQIQIQYGPGEKCVDRSSYKFCPYVVRHKLCGNKYYGQFCCKSCTSAGYLPGGFGA